MPVGPSGGAAPSGVPASTCAPASSPAAPSVPASVPPSVWVPPSTPPSSQIGAPSPQSPRWQVSPVVHALPSSQDVPSVLSGSGHRPVATSQTPASWHWSSTGHWVTAGADPHRPPWHVSPPVQAFPSSQAVPSALGGFVHRLVPGSHVPCSWH